MIVKQFNNCLRKALEYLLAFFMIVMIIAVVWQVFTRFVLQDPASFTDELSRYLLMWIGILGGAYTYSVKRHLALELLTSKLGVRGQKILGIIINLVICAFAAVTLVYGGGEMVSSTLRHGQISPGITIFGESLKMGYVYLVVPFSGALIFYYGLVDIYKLSISFVSLKNETQGR
ncbi:TRAP transporter small permease [Photobacterium damselae]|uniref:TRAP transporter small permease n=1 Tax=Photobacterium damselae TaxID=38293 RepID=UPI001EFE1F1D|nr:TRAP transporter small permease [Photobacterium damselae]MCG9780616.1 TRAP transporter small permease [Photobacterium damselae]